LATNRDVSIRVNLQPARSAPACGAIVMPARSLTLDYAEQAAEHIVPMCARAGGDGKYFAIVEALLSFRTRLRD